METDHMHWRVKLAAWTHDPAEKALILMRDPEGHEGGPLRELRRLLFSEGLPEGTAPIVERADRWAAAADRPQFPKGERERYPAWAQVRFDQKPELIHPLSGQRYDLAKLDDPAALFRAVSFDHFTDLIDPEGDARKTALSFWRFGPDIAAPQLDKLWQLLPADTRVPDHTIWSHLDLTSAFATASCLDAERTPALLAVSFGPVQEFIAQARSTSDLWAGSHLLSRIAWEGLNVVCEEVGPDAVVLPQLRGIPLVDLWLQQEIGLPNERFAKLAWRTAGTDSNPLFTAALPNRFVAIVPASQAAGLAERITERVRNWVASEGEAMLERLLSDGEHADPDRELPCWGQLAEQLAGFPEVHWAAVPWSLAHREDSSGEPAALREAQAPFLASGFLDSTAWRLLCRELQVEGQSFFRPNDGTLYPALYELLDRVAAAAKGVRPFEQRAQKGYRDSLSGEAEWLTTDREQLALTPRERLAAGTLWTRAARSRRFGIRDGEHLSALGMLKRLWPTRFADWLREADIDVDRYVVSTHTMALASSLERWLKCPDRKPPPQELMGTLDDCRPVALPRRLATTLDSDFSRDQQAERLVRRLPAYLDRLRDERDEEGLRKVEKKLDGLFDPKPEAYYALILMDGDRMGAWLSGAGKHGEGHRLPYRKTWHSQVVSHLDRLDSGDLKAYLDERRAVSPARHMAISDALNAFSQHLARHVVEDVCLGKLIYAGGDDLMAMVSVGDLLRAMTLLRHVYSGSAPPPDMLDEASRGRLSELGNGHAVYRERLFRLMGGRATASMGAVVVHHTAPLAGVLRELRAAEAGAKAGTNGEGERDGFCIRVLKRSGGAIALTCRWQLPESGSEGWERAPMARLMRWCEELKSPELSRRVAYLAQDWLPQLPRADGLGDPAAYQRLLASALAYQLDRQGMNEGGSALELAQGLAGLAVEHATQDPKGRVAWLQHFIGVAEFLARRGAEA